MPRRGKKKHAAPENSAATQLPPPVTMVEKVTPPARDSSSITVHPSIYHDGFVGHPFQGSTKSEIYTNIVCEAEYGHLSPEELRFLDLEINWDPALMGPHSFEEARLRYYLDEGRTPVPQFGLPTAAPPFSVSSGVKPTPEAVAAVPHSSFSYTDPGQTFDGESALAICSLCAASLGSDAQGFGEDEERPSLTSSRHRDTRGQKKRSRVSRSVRRLERTVESLSHGLLLALTGLKELQGRSTAAGSCKPDNSRMVDAQSTSLSGLSTAVDPPDNTPGASAPDVTVHPLQQPDLREGAIKCGPLPLSREPKLGPLAEANNVANHITMRNDSPLFISGDRSPISKLLKPILDFMACPEVFQFLKWAEAHPGLKSTQLFDLFWVADSLFNVHGGILIYCLQKSIMPMDAISGATGLSAWSDDLDLMQRLDETYRMHLRPCINTDGSRDSVAKVAWKAYCLDLGGIFSEQFPDWLSATPFFQNLSREYDNLGPILTSSYIEDLSALWTEVHPALLEVTRWFEPFIDYGPDHNRTTPLYDATIALGRHAHELFNRQGSIKEPSMFSTIRTNNLMQLLYEHRPGDLRSMQREMETIMRSASAVSEDFDTAALVDRAKQATLWCVAEPRDEQMRDALALREVHVMLSYRPRLLRAGTAAARIRSEVFEVLVQTSPGRWANADADGGHIGESEVFWDGISRH